MGVDPLNVSEEELHSLSMEGIALSLPPGWESRIRRAAPTDTGAVPLPVLHAATVPLPSDRADYGGGVVETLGDSDVFVSLIEFGSEASGSKLYPVRSDVPQITPEMFHPFQLQRKLPGQAGLQVFFTLEGRPFCLYVVIGSHAHRFALTTRANELVQQLTISPRP